MKRLLIFLGFMAFGTWMLYLLSVGTPTPRETEFYPEPANLLTLKNVIFRQQLGSQLQMEFLARETQYNEQTEEADLTMVTFTVFEVTGNFRGQVAMEGQANRAFLIGKTDRVILVGNVIVRDAKGIHINSERLEYDDRKKLMISPGKVIIKSPDAFHEGDSMVYDLNKNLFTLARPIFYQ